MCCMNECGERLPAGLNGICASLAGVVVAVSGAWGLVDLQSFRLLTRVMFEVSPSVSAWLTILVCAAHLSIGGLLVIGIGRRFWEGILAGVAAAGALALIAFLVSEQHASCNCPSGFRMIEDAKSVAATLVARDILILALLAAATPGTRIVDDAVRNAPDGESAHGFTLLETLIVIAIIALIAVIALPSMRSAKSSAWNTATLAALAGHAKAMNAYSGDWNFAAPYFTDPHSEWTTVSCSRYSTEVLYFGAYNSWNIALADCCYEGNHRDPSFILPPGSALIPMQNTTGFWYSASFLASPDFWRYEDRIGPAQWRSTRFSEVRFPSGKGLVVVGPWYAPATGSTSNASYLFACVDGSGHIAATRDLMPYYGIGEGYWPGTFHWVGMPVMHTIDGVEGRDLP